MRVLFELKSDLHVLYGGARVLGAMDDSLIKHDGELTAEAIERARRGIVRCRGWPLHERPRGRRSQHEA